MSVEETSGSGVAGDGILPDHAWAAGEAGEPSFSRPLRDSETVTLAQRTGDRLQVNVRSAM